MKDKGSFRYGDGYTKHFKKSEREIASVLLTLNSLVDFSDSETRAFSLKWGATRLRTGYVRQQQPSILLPVEKSPSSPEVGNSMSSCLTGDMEKTPPQTSRREGLGECSSSNERLMINSSVQRNIFPVLDTLPVKAEDFCVPLIEKPFWEHERVVVEQKAAQARHKRIALPKSKKLKGNDQNTFFQVKW